MDYEKAYKEALERAKSFQEKYGGDYAGYIFPELRESEDERIRKELIKFLQNITFITDDDGKVEKVFYADTTIQKVEKWISWLEKQKEIPMPTSTELIEMWDKEEAMLKEKDFRGDEWRLAYNAFMDGFARGTCVKFEKQKEQEPTEWSEEDEEMLEYIIGDVNDAKQLYTTQAAKDMADKEIAWLKSLRPSWKPSELQMKALQNAVALAAGNKVLAGLYEQLKSL